MCLFGVVENDLMIEMKEEEEEKEGGENEEHEQAWRQMGAHEEEEQIMKREEEEDPNMEVEQEAESLGSPPKEVRILNIHV